MYLIPAFQDYWALYGSTGSNSEIRRELHIAFECYDTVFPRTMMLSSAFKNSATYTQYGHGSSLPSGSSVYGTNEIHNGSVTVDKYTSKYASGTFFFDAVNSDGEIVHITDGQFDIEF